MLFRHQIEALEAWRSNKLSGLLEMCTGSGKTLTALEAASWLHAQPVDSKPRSMLVIVACPTKVLVEQWDTEIQARRPNWLRLRAYESASRWAQDLRIFLEHAEDRTYAVIGTYDTVLSSPFVSVLDRTNIDTGHTLFIADEAHHLATPSRLEVLEKRLPRFEARMALTATPEIEARPDLTDRLKVLFGGTVFSFSLVQAIHRKVLCPYDYYPRPAFLNADSSAAYVKLTTELGSADSARQIELYRQKRELLRQSGVYLAEFERLLDQLLTSGRPMGHTVVYSPPGREKSDDERIIAKIKGALSNRNLRVASITAETSAPERQEVLVAFRSGKFDVLLGIGCLDEGIDVPETKRAIVLYSFDRTKQFIQRRGRVLRRAPGKDAAEIYDLIQLPQGAAIPPDQRERILERELRRYREFASGSRNASEAQAVLDAALAAAG